MTMAHNTAFATYFPHEKFPCFPYFSMLCLYMHAKNYVQSSSPAGLFLDENTHTGIVHAVVGSLKLSALESYIKWLKHLFLTGEINREDIKEFSLEASRR